MGRGGTRKGAGRPKGTGTFGETTKPVRIPVSMIEKVSKIVQAKGYELPLYGSKVQAGVPTQADDYVEDRLDLNEHLIHHPTDTFFVKVAGESMIGAGIFPNDILIVDRRVEAKNGQVVVAAIEGELTVKRLSIKSNKILLMPENEKFEPIDITGQTNLVIWGTVTSVIHYP